MLCCYRTVKNATKLNTLPQMLNPQNFWVYLLLRYLSYIDGFLYDSVSCRNPTASVLSRQLSEVRLLLFSDVVSIFVNIYMNE